MSKRKKGSRNIFVNQHECKIRKLVESSTRSGLEIARALSNAEAELKKDFKLLQRILPFSYSKTQKLLKIGKSTRISEYEDKLMLIDSWSTLHTIAILTDDQFEAFKNEYLSAAKPQYFMRSDVEKFRRERTDPSNLRTLAIVKVKFDLTHGKKIHEIQEALKNIQRECAYDEFVEFEIIDIADKLNERAIAEEVRKIESMRKEQRRIQMKTIKDEITNVRNREMRPGATMKEAIEMCGLEPNWLKDPEFDLNEALEILGFERFVDPQISRQPDKLYDRPV